MSQHKITLEWKRQTPDFKYETYDRTHQIKFEGGIQISASGAVEFYGKKELVNPEEMLVAALSSCHMLTFLAISCKSGFIVDSYQDEAVGVLEKGSDGKLWVTETVLKPKVTFSGQSPSHEKLHALHEKSHQNCFIANSVKTEVRVEPVR